MSRLPAGRPRSEHTTPQLSPIHSHFTMDPNSRTSPREGHMNPPVSLPSLRHLSSTPPTPSDKRYPDSFRGLLNPQAEIIEQQRDRRRSGSLLETPSPVETQNSQSLPSLSRPPSVDSAQDEQASARTFAPPSLPRHMVSPKTSRIQRPSFNAPTGTIDAHAQPFLGAVPRPSESVSSHTALPTPPPGNRVTYFPPAATIIHQPHNPAFQEGRRPSVGFPMSGSASPSAQYSPYSQPASIDSSQYDNPNVPPQYVFGHSNARLHDGRSSAGPAESDRSMIAMAPSPQSSIQLMTIKSQQGHPVQIPVDVQAASKVADEKRRRNAGASARFRARRKEKEREASQSISRLEQQLRDAIEDAEYYRMERDHFKSVVYQQPGAERHYARPPSPRLRRPAAPLRALSSTRGGSVDSYDYEDEDQDLERNVRPRTNNYIPATGPPSADVSVNDLNPQHASGAPFAQAYPGPMSNGNHPQQAAYRDQTAPAAMQHPHSERTVYRDHFSTDHGNRPWASGQPPHQES